MKSSKMIFSILKNGGKGIAMVAFVAGAFYVGILSGKPATSTSGDSGEASDASHESSGSGGMAGMAGMGGMSDSAVSASDTKAEKPQMWTCAMHPQIQLPEPGKCPICTMTLIPMSTGFDDSKPRRLVMSPSDKKLAEIETEYVVRRFADARVRLVGKIEYDETRVKTISSYVPGRIDRLYVNYTGIEVNKSDHLAEIYSPELLTAQEELLEAKRRVAEGQSESSKFLRASDERALQSAREKLRLYGFSEQQIAATEKRGTPEDHMRIIAPLGGIVVKKSVNEGDYVNTGSNIYTVADLSKVWVKLDAYETDLPWIRFGQHVDIQAEAYPGEHFDGIIAFIDPVLDEKTRTVKVRVNVENSDGRLKPGIFVHGTVHSRVAQGGRVMDSALAGKWIGPMHPDIVRDKPGLCPICGMPLLKAEDLGYVSESDDDARPLIVPVTAVMRTGRRAIVYVQVPGTENPTYDGREIILGSRAGDFYIVKSGLTEGERVVTNGNFNIDSSLQIQARPSMMTMEGESPEDGGDIATFREEIAPLYKMYFDTQALLAKDDFAGAKEAFQHAAHQLEGIDMTLLEGNTHEFWMRVSRQLAKSSEEFNAAGDIETARLAFEIASRAVIELEQRFGHVGDKSVVEVHCPMAFERGASWLQLSDTVANPYLGTDMPTCGNVMNEYHPKQTKAPAAMSGHKH
jgi:membrane fusion protein, copper/silver efflux system